MADSANAGRYQSLSQLQSPGRPIAPRQVSTRQLDRERQASEGNANAPAAGGMKKYPQRPGKMGHLVRMASDVLLIPARTTSYHEPKYERLRTKSRDYGAMRTASDGDVSATGGGGGVQAADTSAIADDDDEDPAAVAARARALAVQKSNGNGDGEEEYDDDEDIWGHARLILLTLGLAGAQLTWTIELGYGTPYLLSLGLSKELTSLVWLAGPLSGFIVQPLIGALSDNSSSKYRRRRWVVYATILITISTLVLGFAHELATWLVDVFARGEGDWDPSRKSDIRLTAIGLAVAAFYVLDFSLNGIQAALRALVLDLVPSEQQTVANAYLARMTNIGNIVGYGFGYANLAGWSALRWVGGGQFRKLCIVAVIVLLVSVTLTCATNHEEKLAKRKRNKSLKATFVNIWNAAKDLPIPIRRICYVQLFAWSGYFPVMFYSTTWVGVRYLLQYPDNPPTDDEATRAGSFSLLLQAIIAVLASIFLPVFQAIGASDWLLDKPPTTFWNACRTYLSWWTARNIWTGSHAFFVVVMAATFWAKTREEATAIVALLGIPWAITCWVPFAILMEFIREMEAGAELNADEIVSASAVTLRQEEALAETDGAESFLSVPGGRGGKKSRSNSRRSSTRSSKSARLRAQKALAESRPLLEGEEQEQPQAVGGTILGIHNLAIVSPQFFTAMIAAAIFKLSELASQKGLKTPSHGIESGADVVWVLRFGGLMTVIAFFVSRYVPAPPSEQTYVTYLKEANIAAYTEDDE